MKLEDLHEINQLNAQYQALLGIWETLQKPDSKIVVAATDRVSGETHALEITANEVIEVVQKPRQLVMDRLRELGVDV